MKQDEIIEMARQSQQESFCSDKGHWFKMEAKDLERFAKLVAAKEREACANVCNAEKKWWDGMSNSEKDIHQALDNALAIIRERGEA